LFGKNAELKMSCGKGLVDVESIFRDGTLRPYTAHAWATHSVMQENQRIFLRFEGDQLHSFEAFFNIPGRFAAASLGRHACSESEAATGSGGSRACMAEVRKAYAYAARRCRQPEFQGSIRSDALSIVVDSVHCGQRGPLVQFAISNVGRETVTFRRVELPWSNDGPNVELRPSVEALQIIRWMTSSHGARTTISLAPGEKLTGQLGLWEVISDSQVNFANGLGKVRLDWTVAEFHAGSFEVDFSRCPLMAVGSSDKPVGDIIDPRD
jgi:hypothetical protein